MCVNSLIQLLVIIIHGVVIYIRHNERAQVTFKMLYTSIVQIILIVLFIYEFGINDLAYKKWYWFVFDILLAFCFLLRLQDNEKLNNIKNKKINWL